MSDRICDYLILGSGITGMSTALFLASTGAKVTVLERSGVIGGSMQRFRRKGVPLDTGFHFTGGIPGCFEDMLRIAGIFDQLKAIPVGFDLFFTGTGNRYSFPRGHRNVEDYLAERFPEQAQGIHDYLTLERNIADTTPLFDVFCDPARIFDPAYGESDYFTLENAMDRFQISGEARAILCGSVTCHGTPPEEIALSGHSRVNYGLFHELMRLEGGGGAVVEAFRKRAAELGVEVLTNCTVRQFDPGGKTITGAELTDGSRITFGNCIFTIHPESILSYLPEARVSEDFRARIGEYEESCGFVTVHVKVDPSVTDFREELCSVLSTDNMNDAILCRNGQNATGLMLSRETDSAGTPCQIITAFQSTLFDELSPWYDTVSGKRGTDYETYKREKQESIIQDRILRAYPHFAGKLEVLDCATQLTFRDWLSPYGSAYGIRQKMRQHNIFGRLPVRNFYACGHSAMLPGVYGAMISALVLFRKLAGEEAYLELIQKQLKRTS